MFIVSDFYYIIGEFFWYHSNYYLIVYFHVLTYMPVNIKIIVK